MPVISSKSKYPSFWFLNSIGWLLLWIIYMALYYRQYIGDLAAWAGLFLTYFSAFWASVILRTFYKSSRFQTASILYISCMIILSSILASQVWYWLDMFLSIPLHGWAKIVDQINTQSYMSNTFSKSFTLVTWSAIYFGITLWIEWNIQKERTEKAMLLAHSAQLQMLRYQLNPHFLFNALNSIRALIEEDKKKARNMITELSEFLRYSLISRTQDSIPLSHELEAIRHYLEIEKKRYEDKLQLDFRIDPNAENFPVLSFLIHPLIENALKYGMQTSPMPLKISLNAVVKDDTLQVEVCNTGKWVKSSGTPETTTGTGTGLENVRLRLENAFPQRHKFDILEENGLVKIVLQISKADKKHEK